MKSQNKVFVGVSGGVDSSVALALLKKATPNNFEKLFGRPTPPGFRGFNVTGVFLKVWNPPTMSLGMLCNWREERRSAMRVCATLGVPFMTLDCEKEYKERVVDYMLSEYKAGRTPNPDVFCNKEIKFGVFLKKARELGADFVATGHYAIRYENHANNTKIYELKESADKEKDQSYFLYQLNQDQLTHALFPIGHLHKSEVRELARKFNLPTAEKKDSQGLCFIGKVDMKDFLAHYIETSPGDVLNERGKVIGEHDGALFYTIGERHGFRIFDSHKTDHDERLFVMSKDMTRNTITVGTKEYTQHTNIYLRDVNWIVPIDPSKTYGVRFRYRQQKQSCKVILHGEKIELIPEQEQIIASGQSAVLYLGDSCVGGGIIE